MRVRRNLSRGLLVAWLCLPALPVLAQSAGGDEDMVQYERRTEISFDDDTIQGDLTKPDIDYIEARKKVRHKSLIKIRENFRAEILQSVGDL